MSAHDRARRVLVVGSANVDFTVAVPRLPAVGETVTGGTLLVNHGGKGANQAVAARRLGAEVRFIACVGDDSSGRDIRAALAAEGIGVEGVGVTREAATGTALIVVDQAGRNQIAVAPGANWRLSLEHVRARADDFAWAQVVVCQLETSLETLAWTLEEARRRGVGTAIVTLGAEGAMAGTAQGEIHARALPVSVVDTTAAGDAFNGALAATVGGGNTLESALRFANAAAGLACTRRGAQPSLPTRAEVDRLLGTQGRGGCEAGANEADGPFSAAC